MDMQEIWDEQRHHIGEVQEIFKRVFSTSDGQLVLKYITKKCLDGMGTLDNTETVMTNVGKQSIFVWLMNMLELDRDMYLQLFMKEELNQWNQANR